MLLVYTELLADYSLLWLCILGCNAQASKPMLIMELNAMLSAPTNTNSNTGTAASVSSKRDQLMAVSLTSLDSLKKLLNLMSIEGIITCRIDNGAMSVGTGSTSFGSSNQEHYTFYSVNVNVIIDKIKHKTLHSMICEKYGVESGKNGFI